MSIIKEENMFINVPRGPEKTVNEGRIIMESLKIRPVPEPISAHVPAVHIDKQIGKPYNSDFFKNDLEVKKFVCQCE